MDTTDNITATITLREATRDDLVVNQKLNIGLEYYVKNTNGNTLSGKHTVTATTDVNELNQWFKQHRLFVLVSCLECPITINR